MDKYGGKEPSYEEFMKVELEELAKGLAEFGLPQEEIDEHIRKIMNKECKFEQSGLYLTEIAVSIFVNTYIGNKLT